MASFFSPGQCAAITHDTLLVTEGRDMFGFSLALVRQLGLDQRIEVRNGGGLPDFHDYFQDLANISGFANVVSLGVMRDNETDPTGAFQAVFAGLRRRRFPRCHFNQRQALPSRGSTSICCPIPRHPECWKPCAGVPWEVIRVFPALSSIWTASANRLANPWLTRRSQGSTATSLVGTTVASLGPGCPRRLFPMGISSF